MKRALFILAAVALVSGTAFAQKANLDKYWQAASAKGFAAAGQFSRAAAWKPGQYVIVGTLQNGKRDSVSTTLLVSAKDGNWVIETRSVDKKGVESVTQMCLSGMDTANKTGDASGIDLLWIKTRDKDGTVQTMEGSTLAMVKGLYKSVWEQLVMSPVTYADGGDVEVPAGSFKATTLVSTKTKIMGFTVEGQTWFHPSVPVNGIVKYQSKDKKTVNELLAFGNDGIAIIK